MATSMMSQIAVLADVKCELCDYNEIAWKCLVCDELMCHNCKKIHLKSKMARNHKVVSLDGVEIKPRREIKCQHHPTEDIERYCELCQLPVCITCVSKGTHENHQLLKINELLENKERELGQMVAESKQKSSTFTEAIRSIKKNQSDLFSHILQCITEVKARNIELKNKLDTITSEFIKQLQQIQRKHQEQMKKTEKLLEEDLSSLKELTENCEDKLMKQEIEMIQFVTQVKQRLDKFRSCDPPVPLMSPTFVAGDVDVQNLKAIFGNLKFPSENVPKVQQKIKNSDTKPINDAHVSNIISTFTVKDRNIISAVSNDQVWMGRCTRKDVNLVTKHGDIVQTINTDFDLYDTAVTQSGELLATVCSGNVVKKLMSNNTFVDFYEVPKEYVTRGITVADNNDIVVCLYNHDTKEGKLVQLSQNGSLTKTIQYNKNSETPLFDNPYLISSNRNGDFIVRQFNKSVVVVDKTANRRFTYTGQIEGLKKPFDPVYTVTDKNGHIIISDYDNSVIHLLDKDGNFIQFVLTSEYGLQNPWGLSIDTLGRLWVCSREDDKVMVIKYV